MIKVIAAILVGFTSVGAMTYLMSQKTVSNIVVTDKEKQIISYVDSDNKTRVSSRYIVFTRHKYSKEVEVFENTDSLWFWKWNSSDVQAQLELGAVCEFDVVGVRVPILSWYRNILEARCES